MAKAVKTYLYCFDDHRSFSEDVRKRFSDETRYTVVTFHNMEDIRKKLLKEKDNNFCKVAILGLQDSKENFDSVDQLITDIKKIDRSTGIILLGPADKMEEIKATISINIDSYIPRNANQILRIHNTVKKLISEHSLLLYTKRRNFSFYILTATLLAAILFAIVAYFRLPVYF